MAKKGQKFKRYSIDLKRQVITEKLNLDTPIIELTNKYFFSRNSYSLDSKLSTIWWRIVHR